MFLECKPIANHIAIENGIGNFTELYESPSIVRKEKTERRQRLAEEAEKKKLEHERQEISTKG
jgi:hypothetical protein